VTRLTKLIGTDSRSARPGLDRQRQSDRPAPLRAHPTHWATPWHWHVADAVIAELDELRR